jgi:hypothetical protein
MALFKKKDEKDTDDNSKFSLKELKELFQEAYRTSETRRHKWKTNYKYFMNTVSTDGTDYKSSIRVNYCYMIPMIKVPVMTQNKPTVNFISYDKTPEMEERARMYSKLVGNALWNKLEMADKLVSTTTNSSIYDAGFYKVGWDVEADGGVGEVFVSSIEPYKVFVDPNARDMDSADYVIHVEPYSVEKLKRKYPKFKEQIKEDKEISDILYEDRKNGERNPVSGTVTTQTKFAVKRAFVKEYWLSPAMCDQSVQEVVEKKKEMYREPVLTEDGQIMIDMETNEPKFNEIDREIEVKAPKYRYGRVITTINDDIIVDDKPNPYKHGKFPFVPQIMNRVPNEFYGISDIEPILPLQSSLNKRYQQMDDIMSLLANPQYAIDPSVGKESIRKVANALKRPGNVIPINPNQLVPMATPQFPQELFLNVRDIVQKIEVISGVTDILQGRGNIPHRTARGIEHMHEAATSRIGLSIRNAEVALKRVAYLMLSVVQQFYKEDRTYAVTSSAGDPMDILNITPEDLEGEFEVTIDSGSALPQDKQSKADLAFNLYGNKIFELALSPDPAAKEIARTVLDTVEFPNRERLLNFQPQPPQPPMGPQQPQQPNTSPNTSQLPPEVAEMANAAGAGSIDNLLAMLGGGPTPQ